MVLSSISAVEDVEPGGFEAISRWSSPPTVDDTTGGLVPKLSVFFRGYRGDRRRCSTLGQWLASRRDALRIRPLCLPRLAVIPAYLIHLEGIPEEVDGRLKDNERYTEFS